jgi:hypothetical protein
MNIKTRPNHSLYLNALSKMTPTQRLAKAFELSSAAKELFLAGLHKRFPTKNDDEIKKIFLDRIAKRHNRNY